MRVGEPLTPSLTRKTRPFPTDRVDFRRINLAGWQNQVGGISENYGIWVTT